MRKYELDRIIKINSEFNYDIDLKNKDVHEDIENLFKQKFVNPVSPKRLSEETFDDFDTVYEQLKFATEIELRNFVFNLLNNFCENFIWSFIEPSTEVFRDAFEHAFNTYSLRDERVREQFINRIKVMFQNIFMEKFHLQDEEKALDLADKYTALFKDAVGKISQDFKDRAKQGGQSIGGHPEVKPERRVDYR